MVGIDTHIVMISSPAGQVPTPIPNPFSGTLDDALSADVKIHDKKAATVDSTASNSPKHIAAGGSFQQTPGDSGTVKVGSDTVLINDKKAARDGDAVETCNDPSNQQNGKIIASGTVIVGS